MQVVVVAKVVAIVTLFQLLPHTILLPSQKQVIGAKTTAAASTWQQQLQEFAPHLGITNPWLSLVVSSLFTPCMANVCHPPPLQLQMLHQPSNDDDNNCHCH